MNEQTITRHIERLAAQVAANYKRESPFLDEPLGPLTIRGALEELRYWGEYELRSALTEAELMQLAQQGLINIEFKSGYIASLTLDVLYGAVAQAAVMLSDA